MCADRRVRRRRALRALRPATLSGVSSVATIAERARLFGDECEKILNECDESFANEAPIGIPICNP